MIYRLGATGLAVTLIAVQAVQAAGASVATAEPVIWHFLGYPFEAAGMISAVFGCIVARVWVNAAQHLKHQYRLVLDAPITAAVFGVTVALVIWQRPAPLIGIFLGLGMGMLGEGVFKLAELYTRKILRVAGIADDPPPAP
ncbi:hypothetical protein [Sphingomonas sp. OTU376]|uniref:hypothetical protein n=1 Tax=Sphingomonas sp. OTU376 TaxID=3043863 RepID=UPI00313B7726